MIQNRTAVPRAVYALAIGTFAVGTSEFLLAGILPEVASDQHVSVATAGWLVTAFAIGMLVGAPLMTLATLRLPRRATAVGALAVFVAAHVVPLLVDGFTVLVVTRVIAAVAAATYWAMAAVMAARLAGPDALARAMAVVVGGLTIATVLGVPVGTWIGGTFGWRASLATVAVVAAGCAVLVHVSVPGDGRPAAVPDARPAAVSDARPAAVPDARPAAVSDTRPAAVPMRELLSRESAAFRRPRLWVALATTALFQAAVFCAYTYVAVLLTDVSGVPASRVPLALLLFGLGSLAGVVVGGRIADRGMLANVLGSLVATAVALVLLASLAHWAPATLVVLFLLGAAAFSIAAALNGRVIGMAGDAPTLAASVNVSAFNVGNALGPWVGGVALAAGAVAPVWAGVGLVTAAIAAALLSVRIERERVGVSCDASGALCDQA
ncbi:MFS transporter [Tsukamurella sp. 8F]|uniref:MFS transporter n=1 Tax=unclassified Tsukamurella TaxID=2633480 RepID=UPI0023B9AA3C|nr:MULTISPECIES: MFS transporter [unclassified Tsukamurella]MDF0531845.1 MFS transporter [Tsukamurella sp. 8J]MDF0589077.1 MFS transporter [Tsukamurella sp. 8F]